MSADLDFDEHISGIVKSATSMVNCIFRCFVVRSPDFYLRLYRSLVLPKLQYCAPVWLPHKSKHWRAIESVQRKFIRRLQWRCPSSGPTPLPDLKVVLSGSDIAILKRIMAQGLTSHFFEVSSNELRCGVSVRSKAIARTDIVNNSWSWRLSSQASSGEIDPRLFVCASPRLTGQEGSVS